MSYSLLNSYVGSSFISDFNWIDGVDPSHGFVSYQSQPDAERLGLYSINPDTQVVTLGVDAANKYPGPQGRPSIRLESIQEYNHGLFIGDFAHMPPSQCGLWPAFWMYGPDWPSDGELDIIEGVNTAYNNIISGHTADGCVQDSSIHGMYTGEMKDTQCAVGSENIGCGFTPPASDTSSYGDGFNAVGGGVYAVQWDSQHLKVWHFPRGGIPDDIADKQPNPDGWGPPEAIFGGSSCDADSFWKNMKLVININFCGDYGNALWQSQCSNYASTCSQYVGNNPQAFTNAYWAINYIDAYQLGPPSGNSSLGIHGPPPAASLPIPSGNGINATAGSVGSAAGAAGSAAGSGASGLGISPPMVGGSAPLGAVGAGVGPGNPGSSGLPIGSNAPPPVIVNPHEIGESVYLGCFGSSSHFKTFNQVADSSSMTLEKCVEACSGSKYAGVFERKCYCAGMLDVGTKAISNQDLCNHPCPGNSSEFCGGIAPGNSRAAGITVPRRNLRRAAPPNYLFTVYGAITNDKPVLPPAMANNLTVTTTAVVATMTYMTVHPNQPNRLIPQEYVATVTRCGCMDDMTRPPIPLKTTVVPCQACGYNGESHVTLTVPDHSPQPAPSSSAVPPKINAVWTPAVVPANNTAPAVVVSSEAGRGWMAVTTSAVLGVAAMAVLVIL